VAAVRRPAETGAAALEVVLLWADHAAADRLRVAGSGTKALGEALAVLNLPQDGRDLAYLNDLGLRLVDTALPGAPVVVAWVESGSAAETSGVKVGDAIDSVDGGPASAAVVRDRVRRKQPGEVLNLRVVSPGAAARTVPVPAQRRPRRGPVFDTELIGNAALAKLTAGAAAAPTPSERDLFTFNLALVYMRFGEWREAFDLLATATNLPNGLGVGRGAATFFRARCLEELGEREKAIALYKEAATADADLFDEDGTTVAEVARRRLAVLAGT
jgi:tetratricopeptide (TPR) repeat protein